MVDIIDEDTLCLLYSLFVSNVPQSVKDEWKVLYIRIFAELEWAHWYYLDNCLNDDKERVGVDFYGFCQQLFSRFPHLVPEKTDWRAKFLEWKRYRGTTCTGSAVIFDEALSMVVLVQGFGNRDSWAFPGGKINQHETFQDCAVREVLEETGLDIGCRIDDEVYLETTVGETARKVFIVEGFPLTTRLEPSTQNEIEAITWFHLENLPCSLQDQRPMETMHLKPNMFFCVIPFVSHLRRYVKYRKQGLSPRDSLARCGGRTCKNQTQSSTVPKNTTLHFSASLPEMPPSSSVRQAGNASSLPTRERFSVTPQQKGSPKTSKKNKKAGNAKQQQCGPIAPPLMQQPTNLMSPSGSNIDFTQLQPPGAFRTPLLQAVTSTNNTHQPLMSGQTFQLPASHFEQTSPSGPLLRVDPSADKKSIFGGRAVLDIEALLDVMAPQYTPVPPTLDMCTAGRF